MSDSEEQSSVEQQEHQGASNHQLEEEESVGSLDVTSVSNATDATSKNEGQGMSDSGMAEPLSVRYEKLIAGQNSEDYLRSILRNFVSSDEEKTEKKLFYLWELPVESREQLVSESYMKDMMEQENHITYALLFDESGILAGFNEMALGRQHFGKNMRWTVPSSTPFTSDMPSKFSSLSSNFAIRGNYEDGVSKLYVYARKGCPGTGDYGSPRYDSPDCKRPQDKEDIFASTRSFGISNEAYGMREFEKDMPHSAGLLDLHGKPCRKVVLLNTCIILGMIASMVKQAFDLQLKGEADLDDGEGGQLKKGGSEWAKIARNNLKNAEGDVRHFIIDESLSAAYRKGGEDNEYIRNIAFSPGFRRPDKKLDESFEPVPNGVFYVNFHVKAFAATKDTKETCVKNLQRSRFCREFNTSEGNVNPFFKTENLKKQYLETCNKFKPLPLRDMTGKIIQRPDTLKSGDIIQTIFGPTLAQVPNTKKVTLKMKPQGLLLVKLNETDEGDPDAEIAMTGIKFKKTVKEDVHSRYTQVPKITYPDDQQKSEGTLVVATRPMKKARVEQID